MLIKNMKIKFNTNELSKARGVLSLAVLKNKEGALHLFSQQKGEDLKIVAYDDKNLQVTQYLSAEILGEDQVDKWLDKSFLNIVKAYADYGSNNIVMEYEIGDGIITFTDENGENTFKISERTPFKTLNEKVLVAQKPQSTISFKSEDLIAAMDAYAYPAVDHFNGMLVTESGTPDEREDAPVLFITRALSPHRLAKGFLQSIEVWLDINDTLHQTFRVNILRNVHAPYGGTTINIFAWVFRKRKCTQVQNQHLVPCELCSGCKVLPEKSEYIEK